MASVVARLMVRSPRSGRLEPWRRVRTIFETAPQKRVTRVFNALGALLRMRSSECRTAPHMPIPLGRRRDAPLQGRRAALYKAESPASAVLRSRNGGELRYFEARPAASHARRHAMRVADPAAAVLSRRRRGEIARDRDSVSAPMTGTSSAPQRRAARLLCMSTPSAISRSFQLRTNSAAAPESPRSRPSSTTNHAANITARSLGVDRARRRDRHPQTGRGEQCLQWRIDRPACSRRSERLGATRACCLWLKGNGKHFQPAPT